MFSLTIYPTYSFNHNHLPGEGEEGGLWCWFPCILLTWAFMGVILHRHHSMTSLTRRIPMLMTMYFLHVFQSVCPLLLAPISKRLKLQISGWFSFNLRTKIFQMGKKWEKGGWGKGVAVCSKIVPNVTKFGMQSLVCHCKFVPLSARHSVSSSICQFVTVTSSLSVCHSVSYLFCQFVTVSHSFNAFN